MKTGKVVLLGCSIFLFLSIVIGSTGIWWVFFRQTPQRAIVGEWGWEKDSHPGVESSQLLIFMFSPSGRLKMRVGSTYLPPYILKYSFINDTEFSIRSAMPLGKYNFRTGTYAEPELFTYGYYKKGKVYLRHNSESSFEIFRSEHILTKLR